MQSLKWFLALPIVATLLTGCGSPGDDTSNADATTDGAADATADSGPPVWSEPVPVMIDDEASFQFRTDPTLSTDELELYYVHRSTSKPFRATRASRTDPWGMPQEVTAIATGNYQTTPRLSGDGRRLYFSSDGPSHVPADVWMSSRQTVTDPWGSPAIVPELMSGGNDLRATPCLGATRFIFESDRDGSYALFELAGGTVRPVETGMVGTYPFVTEDCLTLYFVAAVGSTRTIFVSQRTSVDAAWAMPQLVEEIHRDGIAHIAPWVSGAGDHLVFVDAGLVLGGSPDRVLLESFR